MERQIPTKFEGSIVGSLTQTPSNPNISKARVAILYKGKNRNGTYLTDGFLNEHLFPSLPYAPIVGIYSQEEEDFTKHGAGSSVAKIYGVVPEHPNLTWEQNIDPADPMREYAVCDVYLYTGRLPEAKKIVNSSQSMELDPRTIQGNWQQIDGDYYYVYTKASFFGLSALGKEVEPCFEGAKFFELLTQFSSYMQENDKGGNQMDNTEMNPSVETSFEETPTVAEVQQEPAESVEVTEEPKEVEEIAVEETSEETNEATEETQPETQESVEENEPSSYSICGETLEAYNQIVTDFGSLGEVINQYNQLKENFSAAEAKILEFEQQINTLKAEAENQKNEYASLQEKYSVLETQYKADMDEKKKKMCEKYASYLNESAMNEIQANLDSYETLESLEKDLLYAGRESFVSTSSAGQAPSSYTSIKSNEDGVEALLRKAKENKK